MKHHILLLGPPASGKGTQARQLGEQLGVPCLGTGKLLRDEIEKGSEIGKIAEGFINRGDYVPDDVIMKMVKAWMDAHTEGWILDGFPRTKPQAEALNEICKPNKVIALEVPQSELEGRITRRRECSSCGITVAVKDESETVCKECGGQLVARQDDALESFKVRYKNYAELTEPLFDFYADLGMLQKVDGTMAPDAVYDAILELL